MNKWDRLRKTKLRIKAIIDYLENGMLFKMDGREEKKWDVVRNENEGEKKKN